MMIRVISCCGGGSGHDPRGILLHGQKCDRATQSIQPAYVTLAPRFAGDVIEIYADEAVYQKPSEQNPNGCWLLRKARPAGIRLVPDILEPHGHDYLLKTELTFEQVCRPQGWFQFQSTPRLLREMQWASSSVRQEIAMSLHHRLTRPLANITLLFLTLPFVLSGINQGIIKRMGGSLVISLGFQVFTYLCQQAGATAIIAPSLAAWLPVLIFGALAIGLCDLVRT